MDFLGTDIVEILGGIAQLRSADDGVINHQEFLPADQCLDGYQLHVGDQLALALPGRHEGPGPGGGVLDEGSGKGNAGCIRIADGVGDAGVGNAGDGIGRDIVPLCQHGTALIAHLLDIHALIAGRGIAVVDPEEGADTHILSCRALLFDALRRDKNDLAGTQFIAVVVSQIEVGEVLKGDTVAGLVFAYHGGSPSETVAGYIDARICQQEDGHGPLNLFLCVQETIHDGVALVDDGSRKLGGIDLAAAHLHELEMVLFAGFRDQLILVVDLADGGDGVTAQMRAD